MHQKVRPAIANHIGSGSTVRTSAMIAVRKMINTGLRSLIRRYPESSAAAWAGLPVRGAIGGLAAGASGCVGSNSAA